MTDAKTKKLTVRYRCGYGLYDSEQYVDFRQEPDKFQQQYAQAVGMWQHGNTTKYDVETLAVLRMPSFLADLEYNFSFYNFPVKILVFKKTDK